VTERYTPAQVHYMDAGVVTMGDDDLRYIISDVLAKVPAAVVDRVMDGCRFLMPRIQGKGTFIPAALLEGLDVILLPEGLLDDPDEMETTILHEVAHFWLGHESPLQWDPSEDILPRYDQQEAEAWTQVGEWQQ